MREKIRKKDWKDKTRVYEGKSKKERKSVNKRKEWKNCDSDEIKK